MEKITELINQKEAGLINVNEAKEAEPLTYSIPNYDRHTGEKLADTILPLPSKEEIESHIIELQDTLGKTNADAKRLSGEIASAQSLIDSYYP